jgi:hypothetical protein
METCLRQHHNTIIEITWSLPSASKFVTTSDTAKKNGTTRLSSAGGHSCYPCHAKIWREYEIHCEQLVMGHKSILAGVDIILFSASPVHLEKMSSWERRRNVMTTLYRLCRHAHQQTKSLQHSAQLTKDKHFGYVLPAEYSSQKI